VGVKSLVGPLQRAVGRIHRDDADAAVVRETAVKECRLPCHVSVQFDVPVPRYGGIVPAVRQRLDRAVCCIYRVAQNKVSSCAVIDTSAARQ